MKKDDVIWLLIRIGGFYFLLQSVESVIGLTASYVTATDMPALFTKSSGIFLQSVLLIAVYMCLSLYMLLNGRLFYQLLSSQADEEESQFPSLKDNS
jgi:inner membrane protein involved in colicin E2 resistance